MINVNQIAVSEARELKSVAVGIYVRDSAMSDTVIFDFYMSNGWHYCTTDGQLINGELIIADNDPEIICEVMSQRFKAAINKYCRKAGVSKIRRIRIDNNEDEGVCIAL